MQILWVKVVLIDLIKARIRDTDPAVRATVVAAIRYTFADSYHSYDELLSALIPDFLSLIEDQDLVTNIPLHT